MNRTRRGQAAVEFALILPLLLILLIGIVEFGRAWNQQQVITDAARAAARKGALHNLLITQDSVRDQAMLTLVRAGIDTSMPGLVFESPGWDAQPNFDITVNIQLPYTFTFFGPIMRWTTGHSNIVLKTSYTMRNE